MEYRIGTSGWVYPPWRGVFYPPDLPQKSELAFASRHLTSIEINGSFYSYQKPSTYARWYSESPTTFQFAVKGPQYITHISRLKEVQAPLANFFASGVLLLKEKLGPILWQLPPNFLFKEDRLRRFFELLPHTFNEAKTLAKRSERFEYPYQSLGKLETPIRHAIEVRHHSFENPDFIELLREHKVALVFADTAGKWPYMEDVTSDFIYLRLHGDEELYESGYDMATLRWWADRAQLWAAGDIPVNALQITDSRPTRQLRDIFVYFDNDFKVRAPRDAQTLMKILEVHPDTNATEPAFFQEHRP